MSFLTIKNLQVLAQERTLPPQDSNSDLREKIKSDLQKEREKRYADREKLRRDIEIYGDIFYDWEDIMKEREEKLRREECERRLRKRKADSLSKTWELMIVCKEFLGEWEAEWTMGSEKARIIQEERNKEERFKKIDLQKENFKKKTQQTKLNFGISKLGGNGKLEWAEELKKERMEIQELKENLWRWRENGGGKTSSGKEKMIEPTGKNIEKKLKIIGDILERERKENERCKALKEKEKLKEMEEKDKKEIRLEIKKTLEKKWQTIRWVTKHLEENEQELKEMLVDVQKENENELKQWQKLERFAKIEKLRMESGYDRIEIDNTRPAWREKSKIDKKKIQNLRLEKPSTTPKANLKQC